MSKITNYLSLGKKSLQFLIIITLALIAATSVYLYAQGVGSQVKAQGETVSTYITTSEIPAGLALQDAVAQGLVIEKQIARAALPMDSLSKVTDENAKLVALRDLQLGQILLNSQFGFSVAESGGLPIPDGKVAVSVSLSDVSRVASFVKPGSEVAVFSMYTSKDNDNKAVIKVLFPKLLVLAIGNQVTATSGTAAESNLVTVAATPDEAQKILYAATNTSLYFGLLTKSAKLDNLAPISEANLFN